VCSPFVTPLVWSCIFAVTLSPLHQRFKKFLNGRGTLAAVLITIPVLAVFILPGVITLNTASSQGGINELQARKCSNKST
jgi:predicted PurR-regulated permease PerM